MKIKTVCECLLMMNGVMNGGIANIKIFYCYIGCVLYEKCGTCDKSRLQWKQSDPRFSGCDRKKCHYTNPKFWDKMI